jgi:putative ABC transport system permease protein
MHFLTFILRNITRRPTRSALTVLGLSVAVGSMIALFGITSNVEQTVVDNFSTRGIDLVVQQKGKTSGLDSDVPRGLVDQAKKVPGVVEISWAVVGLISIKRVESFEPVMVQGWPFDNFDFNDLHLLAGRTLQKGDRQKAIIGETLAENYHKQVGDTVVFIQDEPENVYQIVGVFRSNNFFENGNAIVTYDDGCRLIGKKVSGFSVRVDRQVPNVEQEVERVRKDIEALRDPEEPWIQLDAKTPKEFKDNLSQLKLIHAMSWLVTAIAVIVGVIGLLNTMAMSILERTQEIGILRAVGWPPARVLLMVLGEATLLSLAAAVVGTAAAALGVYLLSFARQVNGFIPSGLSLAVIGTGFAITFLIGLLGGIYPAFRAARLLPTEAIRHD